MAKRMKEKDIVTVQDACKYLEHIYNNWTAFITHHPAVGKSLTIVLKEIKNKQDLRKATIQVETEYGMKLIKTDVYRTRYSCAKEVGYTGCQYYDTCKQCIETDGEDFCTVVGILEDI